MRGFLREWVRRNVLKPVETLFGPGMFFVRFAPRMFNVASRLISQPFAPRHCREPEAVASGGGSNFITFSPIDSVLNLENSSGGVTAVLTTSTDQAPSPPPPVSVPSSPWSHPLETPLGRARVDPVEYVEYTTWPVRVRPRTRKCTPLLSSRTRVGSLAPREPAINLAGCERTAPKGE